jgi:hypothetical protein
VAAGRLSLSLSLSLSNWRRRITLNDFFQKPDCIPIFNPFFHNAEQNGVIHAIKKLSDVAFQNEAIARSVPTHFPCHAFKSRDAPMGSIVDAAGE